MLQGVPQLPHAKKAGGPGAQFFKRTSCASPAMKVRGLPGWQGAYTSTIKGHKL